ncbi:hypothetical protein PHYBLDRAFT_175359 [Phycomyces blakesleeanus NRRL 1555(-)]|uniref:Uncharacterized protein n=1 Tax=Phycomyces blakesleeanus (strain ATCC 8743b / DSM 1359 / FGSC 10004 / NBRC 33097 / NRRL 1555) TaxID=763407 RepID=A0A162T504_PHYB8|nr:hypothetical protein PHYBLDRAFT_175359 [Phycomyces blakesleeanus NRRL 1555(-)]OAD66302.1 hypothetical protein PHYBLDRAFT_175359 [Phycomyces blakesleeanus NRRL 1555(-)]|eukprot:XP_018284342.1 hypothetical protein PHYBLDRAFT_175359 [Phycomyces blakesleeanus NRRL 1555(-)]
MRVSYEWRMWLGCLQSSHGYLIIVIIYFNGNSLLSINKDRVFRQNPIVFGNLDTVPASSDQLYSSFSYYRQGFYYQNQLSLLKIMYRLTRGRSVFTIYSFFQSTYDYLLHTRLLQYSAH